MLAEVVLKIVLFGLAIYKLYDLIVTYAKPMLQERMHDIERRNIELAGKKQLLTQTRQHYENELIKQQQLFKFLEAKVRIWHEACSKRQRDEEKRTEEYLAAMHKHHYEQQVSYQLSVQAQKALPQILTETKKFFEEKNKQSAEQFMQTALNFMMRNCS